MTSNDNTAQITNHECKQAEAKTHLSAPITCNNNTINITGRQHNNNNNSKLKTRNAQWINWNKLKCDLERIFNDKNVMFVKLSGHDTIDNMDEVKCDTNMQF